MPSEKPADAALRVLRERIQTAVDNVSPDRVAVEGRDALAEYVSPRLDLDYPSHADDVWCDAMESAYRSARTAWRLDRSDEEIEDAAHLNRSDEEIEVAARKAELDRREELRRDRRMASSSATIASLRDLLDGHDIQCNVRATLSAWRAAAEEIARAACALRSAADAARDYYLTRSKER